MEVDIFEVSDAPHGALRHGFGGDAAVLLEQVEFDGPGVDADPDGHLVRLARVGHEPDLVLSADVAGVDADLVDARLDGGEGEFIVHLDVRDDGHPDVFFQSFDGLDIFHVRDRKADELAAGGRQFSRLKDVRLDVALRRIEHGLDDDGCVSAKRYIAHENLSCLSAFHGTASLPQ